MRAGRWMTARSLASLDNEADLYDSHLSSSCFAPFGPCKCALTTSLASTALRGSGGTAVERQDLLCMYCAHHKLKENFVKLSMLQYHHAVTTLLLLWCYFCVCYRPKPTHCMSISDAPS